MVQVKDLANIHSKDYMLKVQRSMLNSDKKAEEINFVVAKLWH